MNTQVTQTPVELIEYLKTLERIALPSYLEKRGTSAGHDWILIGANEYEIQKLGFSPALWTTLTEMWVVPGRAHLDLIELVGYITQGLTEQRDKAGLIAKWIYENCEYQLNKEAPPWDMVHGVPADCSSFAPLSASLLGICGIHCWGKQVAFWKEERYSHMFILAEIPGSDWMVIDPTGLPPFSRETGGVSAYGLFQIDPMTPSPPVVAPDEPTLFPPLPTWPEIRAMAPWLVNLALGLGLVAAVGRK